MGEVTRNYIHAEDYEGSWDYEYPYDGDTDTHGLMYEDPTSGEWKEVNKELPYDVFYESDYDSQYFIYSTNGTWVEHNANCILYTSADDVYGPNITISKPNLAPGDTTNKLTINGKEVNIQVGDCILLYNRSSDDEWVIYPGNILSNFIISKEYSDYYEEYVFYSTAWYVAPGVWSNTSGANDPTHRIILANCAGDQNGNHGYLDSFYDTPYQRVVNWFEIEPADLSANDTRNPITVNGQTITAQYGNYISFIYGTEYYTTNITDTIEQRFPQCPGIMTYIYPGIWADCPYDPVWVAEYSYVYHEVAKSCVQLKWTDPPDLTDWKPYPCSWEGTVIVRKENSPPLHRWDGKKVVKSSIRDKYKTDPYKDEDIQTGKVYYYGFFPYYTRIEDEDHPIRYYTFTKTMRVETGVISYAPEIVSITLDGNTATITYGIVNPSGGQYDTAKLYGKKGSNPKCDNTDDIVEDVNQSNNTMTVSGLDYDSTYYFCIQVTSGNDKLTSNVVKSNMGARGTFVVFDSDTNYIHPQFTDDSSKFVESGDGQGTRYSFRYRTNNNVTYFGNTIYWGANYGFKWKQPLKKGTAINMYMECECDATGGYSYHTVTLYAAKNLSWGSYSTSTAWKAVNIISYASQSNYAGETPWTYMHKTLVTIPLDTVGDDDIFYIGFHKCDCGLSVTKIYFEGVPELVT